MKLLKALVAVALLPVCYGTGFAALKLLWACKSAELFLASFGAGASCWLVIFAMLPKPMWIYVVGHELTHAAWTWLFGGRVKRFKATAAGGHVVVTKSNFLITLAPYFFPLYAVLVVIVYAVGHAIWTWTPYLPGFHFLLGVAYSFHVTLTVHVLRTEQTDITSQGVVFSAVVIWLGNALLLLVALPLLTGESSIEQALRWCVEGTTQALRWMLTILRPGP